MPPASTINIGTLQPSTMPGFSKVEITVSNDGHTSRPIQFLLSDDGKTLEQVSTYDISADPRTSIPYLGRPSRGGAADAPVIIVGFDDLECPYCARLHASIFPAIQQRYGDKVHIVYRDYPLDMHPWAMRAAVDVNCLAEQSPEAYWSSVDTIHAQASKIGTTPGEAKSSPTLDVADKQLDQIVRENGAKQKVDTTKLDACIAKQDTTGVEENVHLAQSLNLMSTPSLFINGDKVDGAVPIEFIFSVIDKAMLAQGVQPPAPYVPPAAENAKKS